MGEFVSEIFSGFNAAIVGLTTGFKDAFVNFIYVDPESTSKVLSPLVQYLLVFGGVGVAFGVVFGLFKLLRSKIPG